MCVGETCAKNIITSLKQPPKDRSTGRGLFDQYNVGLYFIDLDSVWFQKNKDKHRVLHEVFL